METFANIWTTVRMPAGQDHHALFLNHVAANNALGFRLLLALGFFESLLLGFQMRRLGFHVPPLGLFPLSIQPPRFFLFVQSGHFSLAFFLFLLTMELLFHCPVSVLPLDLIIHYILDFCASKKRCCSSTRREQITSGIPSTKAVDQGV